MSLLWPIITKAISHRHKMAVTDDQREYTYGQLLGGAMFLAEKIDATTGNPHVGILLPTSGAFPLTVLAAWLARRTIVPLNYLLNPAELEHVILDSCIDLIITVKPMLDYLGEERIPKGIDVLLLEDMDFHGFPPLRWPPYLSDEQVAAILLRGQIR